MDQSIKMLIRITSYPALRTSLDDWICQWPEIYFKMSPFRFIKECFVVIIDICLFLKIIYKRSLHYVHSYTLGKHSIWDSLLKVIGPKSHINTQHSISPKQKFFPGHRQLMAEWRKWPGKSLFSSDIPHLALVTRTTTCKDYL